MHYVMVMRDDAYRLVGPFHSEAAAGAWGDDPANNPGDDPRWQVLRLDDPIVAPRVVFPRRAKPLPDVPDALTALRKAADQFVSYERQHRAKGTPEADAKADVNAEMAAMCLAAIRKAEGR